MISVYLWLLILLSIFAFIGLIVTILFFVAIIGVLIGHHQITKENNRYKEIKNGGSTD